MKPITLVATILLLVGMARSATRLGVYTSSTCAEAQLIGYIWLPYPFYAYDNIIVTGCTATQNGQYYDVKTGLAEQNQADRRTDWSYYFTAGDGITCDTLNDTTAKVYAVSPPKCIFYGQLSNTQAYKKYSLYMSGCIAGDVNVQEFNDVWDCPYDGQPTSACTSDVNAGTVSKAICNVPVPGAPIADTPTGSSSPTGSNTPAAATPSNTPVKKSSGSVALSISVGSLVALLAL